MIVAVTGGAGFIGTAVCRRITEDGHEVEVFDRSTGRDIRDVGAAAYADCDSVIHLAGVLGTAELFDAPELAVEVNVAGTLEVLEACRANGLAYVGITMPDVFPSVYTATKIAAHRLADAYSHAYGVPVTHIRPFNVYGEGQAVGEGHPQKIVPTFASRSWRGLPMPVWGDGQQSVDMVHVTDVAENLAYAATHPEDGPFGHCEVWDAGTGHHATVLDVARRIGEITGCGLVEFLPMRRGEIPQERLVAENVGPFTFGEPWDRFTETVESYRPDQRVAANKAAWERVAS